MEVSSGKVDAVSLSLASAIAPSCAQYSFSSQQVTPSANSILLASLSQRQRLDRFADIVGFLARADKLSTSVDCFNALDEISSTLFRVYNASDAAYSDISTCWYGLPELNPCGTLGLGLWYWQKKRHTAKSIGRHHSPQQAQQFQSAKQESLENNSELQYNSMFQKYMVRWSIRAQRQQKDNKLGNGSSLTTSSTSTSAASSAHSPYSARYSTEWLPPMISINSDTGLLESWNEPDFQSDQKAEFVLILDPPVYLPYTVAESLDATVEPPSSPDRDHYINSAFSNTNRTVTHPNGGETKLDISFSSLVPDSFVKVTEVPIAHPKDLPNILLHLRKAILIDSICQSLGLGEKVVAQDQDLAREDEDEDDEVLDSELMLIDALLESDIPTDTNPTPTITKKEEGTKSNDTNNTNGTNNISNSNNNSNTNSGEGAVLTSYQTNVSLIEENDEIYLLVNLPFLNDFAFRVKPTIKQGDGSRVIGLNIGHAGFGKSTENSNNNLTAKSPDIDIQGLETKLTTALELTEDLGIVCAYVERYLTEQ